MKCIYECCRFTAAVVLYFSYCSSFFLTFSLEQWRLCMYVYMYLYYVCTYYHTWSVCIVHYKHEGLHEVYVCMYICIYIMYHTWSVCIVRVTHEGLHEVYIFMM